MGRARYGRPIIFNSAYWCQAIISCQKLSYSEWNVGIAFRVFRELKGDVEIANAQALLSAIVMHESEDLSVYVQRLQELHDLLESLGEPISETTKASNIRALKEKTS